MADYSIQVASKLSGVGTHTLRAWEKRYQAVVPDRNSSGRRVYSDEDVEKLSTLSELCFLGCSIGNIANKTIVELKEMLDKLGKKDVISSGINFREEKDRLFIEQSLNGLLLALEGYKLDIISHELRKLYLSLSFKQLVLDVLVPLVNEVGKRILKGKLTVGQEHALNSIFKFHLGHYIYQNTEIKHKNPSSILIAGPDGDYNSIGIMLASLLCGHYRLNYSYLGENTPADSILETVKALGITHLILINSTGETSPSIVSINSYLNYVLKKTRSDTKVLVSGFTREDFLQYGNVEMFSSLKDLDQILKRV